MFRCAAALTLVERQKNHSVLVTRSSDAETLNDRMVDINIESLTVAEIDTTVSISRISIVTCGTPMVIEQIKAQLMRLVPVHDVDDLSDNSIHVERELALVKIVNTGSNRIEALRIAQSFRAHTVDSTLDSFVFEITGTSSKLAAFINLMKAIGDVEIARSGVCAMSRGKISNLKQRDDML